MERWKDIEEHSDYQISSNGRVYSKKTNRFLRPRPSGWGYLQVIIYDRKKTWTLSIHRLVAEAFIDGGDPSLEVNHMDGDKHNNFVWNLEWVTRSQNNQHAFNTGLRTGRSTSVMIVETGEVFRTVKDCAEHIDGFASGISAVLNGRFPHYKGLRFQYVD